MGPHTLTSPMRYLLSPHVFACQASDYVVLLDLRRDKYLALDPTDSQRLSELVPGWCELAPNAADFRATDGTELAESMLAQGLLTKEGSHGKHATPVTIPRPGGSLVHCYFTDEPRITAGQWLTFFRVAGWAALTLRRKSFEQVVNIAASNRPQGRGADPEQVRYLSAVFEGLRPFVFAGHASCMFDSLALLTFLRHYGIRAQWVFGVTTSPFRAHCWLQSGDIILNDTEQSVSSFTPIMAV